MPFEQRLEASMGECLWMSGKEYVVLRKQPGHSLPMDYSTFHSELNLSRPAEFLENSNIYLEKSKLCIFRSPWLLKSIAFNKHILHIKYVIYFFIQQIFCKSLKGVKYFGTQNRQSQPTREIYAEIEDPASVLQKLTIQYLSHNTTNSHNRII